MKANQNAAKNSQNADKNSETLTNADNNQNLGNPELPYMLFRLNSWIDGVLDGTVSWTRAIKTCVVMWPLPSLGVCFRRAGGHAVHHGPVRCLLRYPLLPCGLQ